MPASDTEGSPYGRAYARLQGSPDVVEDAAALPDADLVLAAAGALLREDRYTAAVALRELGARLALAAVDGGFVAVARAAGPRLADATEKLPLARHTLTFFDAAGSVTHASPRGLAASGHAREAVEGRAPADFLPHGDLRARVLPDIDLARAGQMRAGRARSDAPAGPRCYDYIVVPVGAAEPLGLVALAVDITPARGAPA